MTTVSDVSSGDAETRKSEMFKILIASDIHLGYNERHHLRGDDSFRAFEEVLQAASTHQVDFILLAGDLFHVNKPTITTINRASELIRKYCFGEYDDATRGQRFEIRNHSNIANFIDPNLRVRYPIFTIHGNHDDPTGVQQTSVIDLLDSTGLVNYIGKRDDVEREIVLKPIIMRKGRTKIALYGLNAVHESRLHGLIESDRFNYLLPSKQADDLDSFFKIVMVHQNRIVRPRTHHLDPMDLDELPDMVIWGHEHGCTGDVEYFEPCKYFIYQPGSTVATSLCDAEAGDKYYAIMNVDFDSRKRVPRFKLTSHKLESVRPFLLKTINADEVLLARASNSASVSNRRKAAKKNDDLLDDDDHKRYLFDYCKSEIKHMLQTVRIESSISDNRMLPLIRVRVEYTDSSSQQFDTRKLALEMREAVANPDELIRFVKRRRNDDGRKNIDPQYRSVMDEDDEGNFCVADMMSILDDDIVRKRIQIDSIMSEYFGELRDEKHRLALFSERYLTTKVVDFVEKNDAEVFADLVFNYKDMMRQRLEQQDNNDNEDDLDLDNLPDAIRALKASFEANDDALNNLDTIIREARMRRVNERLRDDRQAQDSFDEDNHNDSDNDNLAATRPTARGRPRGRGRGASTRGRGRGRGKSVAAIQDIVSGDDSADNIVISDNDDGDDDFGDHRIRAASPKKRARGRGRAASTRATATRRSTRTEPIVLSDSDDGEDDADDYQPAKKAKSTKNVDGKITTFFNKRRLN